MNRSSVADGFEFLLLLLLLLSNENPRRAPLLVAYASRRQKHNEEGRKNRSCFVIESMVLFYSDLPFPCILGDSCEDDPTFLAFGILPCSGLVTAVCVDPLVFDACPVSLN